MSKLCPQCLQENADNAVSCTACDTPFEVSRKPQPTEVIPKAKDLYKAGDLIADRYRVLQASQLIRSAPSKLMVWRFMT